MYRPVTDSVRELNKLFKACGSHLENVDLTLVQLPQSSQDLVLSRSSSADYAPASPVLSLAHSANLRELRAWTIFNTLGRTVSKAFLPMLETLSTNATSMSEIYLCEVNSGTMRIGKGWTKS